MQYLFGNYYSQLAQWKEEDPEGGLAKFSFKQSKIYAGVTHQNYNVSSPFSQTFSVSYIWGSLFPPAYCKMLRW